MNPYLVMYGNATEAIATDDAGRSGQIFDALAEGGQVTTEVNA